MNSVFLKKTVFFKNNKHRLKKKHFFSNTKYESLLIVFPPRRLIGLVEGPAVPSITETTDVAPLPPAVTEEGAPLRLHDTGVPRLRLLASVVLLRPAEGLVAKCLRPRLLGTSSLPRHPDTIAASPPHPPAEGGPLLIRRPPIIVEGAHPLLLPPGGEGHPLHLLPNGGTLPLLLPDTGESESLLLFVNPLTPRRTLVAPFTKISILF